MKGQPLPFFKHKTPVTLTLVNAPWIPGLDSRDVLDTGSRPLEIKLSLSPGWEDLSTRAQDGGNYL